MTYTPTAIGTYHWVATYSGSLPNTNGTSHNTACTDVNENVVVSGVAQLATPQDWLPNDTATISSTNNVPLLNGTLTFQLYTGDNCGANSGRSSSRAVLQLHADERDLAGDSQHDEHHVQGHDREPRCLLVARALRRRGPDRSSRSVRGVNGVDLRLIRAWEARVTERTRNHRVRSRL